ncbi:DUF4192 domain-containing protein [Bifidobacterium parmae]|uniref:DUF4192 domain-containing protein n=1 Tax=Bifidobacterium parmae TaxID=361854 RepID=A0A2N5IYW9_9BIFI|nr:DUF4192 domain-containing protein [Bifidobacterium parmae]PLS27144.1 hypothetical protein Uis4E_1730 [Bifidobacterium parmae]
MTKHRRTRNANPPDPPGPGGKGQRPVHADSPDECREFLEGLDELDADVIDGLVGRLRADRRERGPESGNNEWMDGPLDEWLDNIDHGRVDLDEETMATIAVGMHEVLAMRDALILSLIVDRAACDRDMLMTILSRPRTPPVSALVRDLMTAAFESDDGPDMGRCQAGITMFSAMACLMPLTMTAQPFAAIAYILWWLGDCRAPVYALRSLAADEGCTLAAIVLGASERGLGPACSCA